LRLAANRHLRIEAPALLDLLLHGLPRLIRHDAGIWNSDFNPFGSIPQPITALTLLAVGIATPLAPSPDQPAHVERIVEDARYLLWIASNRGGVPLAATRSGMPSALRRVTTSEAINSI
jgi:hypothetical protein